jgi:hypothetical protein
MLLDMILIALLLGCSPGTDTAIIETDPGETGTVPDSVQSNYFQPIALSVSYTGGWDEHQNALLDWAYEGEGYDGYIRLTLVSEDFFLYSQDDPAIEDEYCEIRSLFHSQAAALQAASQADDTPAQLRASFVGELEIYGFIGTACYNLDPAIWTDGSPREAFDGMRLGLGLAPLTDFLAGSWTSETLAAYGRYMLAAYIAINRPDGVGGVEFVARDWTTALLWQWDVDTGEVLTNDESVLMGQDVSDPVLSGWISGYPYWYQGLDELDLDLLAEGTQ